MLRFVLLVLALLAVAQPITAEANSPSRWGDIVREADPRNRPIPVHTSTPLLQRSTLVIDLRGGVPGETAPIDLLRVVFDIAEQAKNHSLTEIRLARDGQTRFLVDPQRFREIGQTRRTENPMYLVRTFPEALRRPDGSRAYGQWTGGVLTVVAEQMREVTEFAVAWVQPR